MNIKAHHSYRRNLNNDADDLFAADIISGLSAAPKHLSPKYFYDQKGSYLFEKITQLPEYYPTRSELKILRENANEIAAHFPKNTALVEFGAGSATKARILLAAIPDIKTYVPVDISAEFLNQEAAQLKHDLPGLAVYPIAADFTQQFNFPAALRNHPKTGFFPGSTIGNFDPAGAEKFLQQAAYVLGPGSLLIVGADLIKSEDILWAAYNDSAGVTAAFNLNILERINRELGANFDLSAFAHKAIYNREVCRIEMHLVSRKKQKVLICGQVIEFQAGEAIHTENSYKFTIQSFGQLARSSGWTTSAVFTDADQYFSIHILSRSF